MFTNAQYLNKQQISVYFRRLGKKGGSRTKELHGHDHFVKMGKLSAAKRKKEKGKNEK